MVYLPACTIKIYQRWVNIPYHGSYGIQMEKKNMNPHALFDFLCDPDLSCNVTAKEVVDLSLDPP